LSKIYRARDALHQEGFIYDLKVEFDYRTLFVKRINEEIAKEKVLLAAATEGSSDSAVFTAVIAWFTENLNIQKDLLKDARKSYSTERARRDSQIADEVFQDKM
jgi:hypothetical protein